MHQAIWQLLQKCTYFQAGTGVRHNRPACQPFLPSSWPLTQTDTWSTLPSTPVGRVYACTHAIQPNTLRRDFLKESVESKKLHLHRSQKRTDLYTATSRGEQYTAPAANKCKHSFAGTTVTCTRTWMQDQGFQGQGLYLGRFNYKRVSSHDVHTLTNNSIKNITLTNKL